MTTTTNKEIRKAANVALKAAQKRVDGFKTAQMSDENEGGFGQSFVDALFTVATEEEKTATAELEAAKKAVVDAEELCKRRNRANRAKWLKQNDWWHVERGGGYC